MRSVECGDEVGYYFDYNNSSCSDICGHDDSANTPGSFSCPCNHVFVLSIDSCGNMDECSEKSACIIGIVGKLFENQQNVSTYSIIGVHLLLKVFFFN